MTMTTQTVTTQTMFILDIYNSQNISVGTCCVSASSLEDAKRIASNRHLYSSYTYKLNEAAMENSPNVYTFWVCE